MQKYKEDLPQPIPSRLRSRPIDKGFPVPWFVAEVEGGFDFRLADKSKFNPAVQQRLCWICGQRLGAYLAFPLGTISAINRTIAEPPSHTECAEWAIKACPFLCQKQDFRRKTHLPDGVVDAGGVPIDSQPGVTCLWVTSKYTVWNVANGVLFKIGDPWEIRWFCQGRTATRQEILDSLNNAYSILKGVATLEGNHAIAHLERQNTEALKLVPT